MINGSIETNKWYTIKVRCEGNNVKVSLDGRQILDVTDAEMAKTGQVGIGTWSTQAKYRNFKVTSLDGQTVLFSETPKVSQDLRMRHWESFGIDGTVTLNTTDAFNGKASLQIASQSERSVGIQQAGFVIKEGETYIVSLWTKQIRGTASGTPLGFRFMQGDRRQVFVDDCIATTEWKQFTTEFTPLRNMEEAVFQLFVIPSGATVLVDQISIMPKSWAENGGFRPELLQAIADLRPPVIRWPGGCFASAYRWKDGIGPQEKRLPYPFSIWDDLEVNSYGTDEFIRMCRLVGSEPIIVINTGTPMWNVNRTPDTAGVDWVQEACDWLEYCNGPATSKWGSVRAANGHPAPYNVKYWEIDNEIELSVEDYIASLKKFVPALKEIDPTIKIIACGSWRGNRMQWDSRLINEVGELFDYLSFHQYDDPNTYANGPGRIGQYFQSLKPVIANSKNPNIKIYDSEWNAQSTDWRTGLYAGGLLNVFERCGDVVEMAGPALFLRHNVATAWDNAFVNFDNKSWYPAPNYVVMKLWWDNYAPNFLELTGEADGINAVATKSDDGKRLTLKAVNPTGEKKEVVLTIAGFEPQNASLEIVEAALSDRNTLEEPNKIAPKKGEVRLEGGTVRFELPALSAGVVSCEL